ncbi:MAG: hypothetical protein NVS2B7_37860 [Herpetosiphon sp.]
MAAHITAVRHCFYGSPFDPAQLVVTRAVGATFIERHRRA